MLHRFFVMFFARDDVSLIHLNSLCKRRGWMTGMTRPARFRETDVTRAIKAFEKAGLCVARAKIGPDGSIEIIAGEPDEAHNANWFAGGPLFKDKAA
jgi:hypothetical protein